METRAPSPPSPPLAEEATERTQPLALEEVEEQWAALSCDTEGDFL